MGVAYRGSAHTTPRGQGARHPRVRVPTGRHRLGPGTQLPSPPSPPRVHACVETMVMCVCCRALPVCTRSGRAVMCVCSSTNGGACRDGWGAGWLAAGPLRCAPNQGDMGDVQPPAPTTASHASSPTPTARAGHPMPLPQTGGGNHSLHRPGSVQGRPVLRVVRRKVTLYAVAPEHGLHERVKGVRAPGEPLGHGLVLRKHLAAVRRSTAARENPSMRTCGYPGHMWAHCCRAVHVQRQQHRLLAAYAWVGACVFAA